VDWRGPILGNDLEALVQLLEIANEFSCSKGQMLLFFCPGKSASTDWLLYLVAGPLQAAVLTYLNFSPLSCHMKVVPLPLHSPDMPASPGGYRCHFRASLRPCGEAGSLFLQPGLGCSLESQHVDRKGQALCPCSIYFWTTEKLEPVAE
jgi:hypothetical protein